MPSELIMLEEAMKKAFCVWKRAHEKVKATPEAAEEREAWEAFLVAQETLNQKEKDADIRQGLKTHEMAVERKKWEASLIDKGT